MIHYQVLELEVRMGCCSGSDVTLSDQQLFCLVGGEGGGVSSGSRENQELGGQGGMAARGSVSG